ncbi:tubulin-tyrosine ligase/Tubulin polyglutamylase [Kipferlia bialata]|uniref:Tubulin--tyrosine ligase-like protein 5 n=1 Tax=Kipferlia bialata TaxID=797122 RepID=A0A9K3CPP3_9EUKA|nr:tubulin-tyrosine ligase/Tubulin polyglutamylase [Kipferlia bialata]|eukprot:g781.t1
MPAPLPVSQYQQCDTDTDTDCQDPGSGRGSTAEKIDTGHESDTGVRQGVREGERERGGEGESALARAAQAHTVVGRVPAQGAGRDYVHFQAVSSLTPRPNPQGNWPTLHYKVTRTCPAIVRATLEAAGFVKTNGSNWNLHWSGKHVPPSTVRTTPTHQSLNHFPHSYEMTRKDCLVRNIQRHAETRRTEDWSFFPKSWILPGDTKQLVEYCEDVGTRLDRDGDIVFPPLIVKPSSSSCGRGIRLVSHLTDLPSHGAGSFVVSEYISNPYLLETKKFDIRVYLLVTSWDPLVMYLHEDGLVRLATRPYSHGDMHNVSREKLCSHLTNYSINKRSSLYKQPTNEDDTTGSKRSLRSLWEHLGRTHTTSDIAHLQKRIDSLLIKTLVSCEPRVARYTTSRYSYKHSASSGSPYVSSSRVGAACFEIYGVDILIDDALNPYLLEVNFCPSFATDSPLDMAVKSRVVAESFNICGISTHTPGRPLHSSLSASPLLMPLQSRGGKKPKPRSVYSGRRGPRRLSTPNRGTRDTRPVSRGVRNNGPDRSARPMSGTPNRFSMARSLSLPMPRTSTAGSTARGRERWRLDGARESVLSTAEVAHLHRNFQRELTAVQSTGFRLVFPATTGSFYTDFFDGRRPRLEALYEYMGQSHVDSHIVSDGFRIQPNARSAPRDSRTYHVNGPGKSPKARPNRGRSRGRGGRGGRPQSRGHTVSRSSSVGTVSRRGSVMREREREMQRDYDAVAPSGASHTTHSSQGYAVARGRVYSIGGERASSPGGRRGLSYADANPRRISLGSTRDTDRDSLGSPLSGSSNGFDVAPVRRGSTDGPQAVWLPRLVMDN